jgi:Flp pilus assembly protein TadB
MTRVVAIATLGLWVGATLLLSQHPRFSRPTLTHRLAPYLPGDAKHRLGLMPFSFESMRELAEPFAALLGGRIARGFGISEPLDQRLRRVHSELDGSGFRMRQLGLAVGFLVAASIIALALRPPAPVSLLLLVSAPLIGFLGAEQALSQRSQRWQRRLFLELPVVSEQIAMLLSAGFSLGAALHRVTERGNGACAADLARALRRVAQGVDTATALREWAELAQVPAVERLTSVLALNHQASNLDRLMADETEALRREVQRELIASIEKSAQAVWIPVTVATLLPGTIFLAVPFFEAMRLFGSP